MISGVSGREQTRSALRRSSDEAGEERLNEGRCARELLRPADRYRRTGAGTCLAPRNDSQPLPTRHAHLSCAKSSIIFRCYVCKFSHRTIERGADQQAQLADSQLAAKVRISILNILHRCEISQPSVLVQVQDSYSTPRKCISHPMCLSRVPVCLPSRCPLL